VARLKGLWGQYGKVALAVVLLLAALTGFLGCLVVVSQGSAQQPANTTPSKLVGRVVDAFDPTTPIAGATVYVMDSGTSATQSRLSSETVTAANGTFSLLVAPVGTGTLRVRPPDGSGYVGVDAPVRIPSPGAMSQLRLSVATAVALSDITAVAIDPPRASVGPGEAVHFRAEAVTSSGDRLPVTPVWCLAGETGTIREDGTFIASSQPQDTSVLAVLGTQRAFAPVFANGADSGPERPDHVPVSDDQMTTLERRAFDLVNGLRTREGLPALRIAPDLVSVARDYSELMAKYGFFGHVWLGNSGPGDRVSEAGIDYRTIGENLARNNDGDDPVAVAVASWSQASTHWELLTDPRFEEAAIGAGVADNGVWYFTQLFIARPK